jgi:chemotaxis protein MotB
MLPFNRLLLGMALLLTSGCAMQPSWQVRRAQAGAVAAQRQNQLLASQISGMSSQLSQAEWDRQQLMASLQTAEQRIANLQAERHQLHQQFLTGLPAPGASPLNSALTRQLAELSQRYPQFEFDPFTGTSRFHDDLLFASGSDEIRDQGINLLREFAKIMIQPEAREFHILVVGHTDDRPVVQPTTRARHETNWELSAHRATRVARFLAAEGIAEPRLGIAGYNQYQPAAANSTDTGRQRNRRAEIYILAPDARIAGRDLQRR